MNILDLILLGLVFLFGLRGYFKGLFRETLSLAGLTVGFMAAVRYNHAVALLGEEYWKISPFILKGVAFVAIFFVVYLLFNWVGWLLDHSQRLLFLRTLNRAGGIVIGVAKGAAVMALLVFFASSASWVPPSAREKFETSIFVPPLTQFAEQMIRVGKERIFTEDAVRVQWFGARRALDPSRQ